MKDAEIINYNIKHIKTNHNSVFASNFYWIDVKEAGNMIALFVIWSFYCLVSQIFPNSDKFLKLLLKLFE